MATPNVPNSITVPDSIESGKNITVTWEATTDADGNLAGYKLERKFDDTEYEQVSDVTKDNTLTFSETINKGSHSSVQYRVKAYDDAGEESEYKESTVVTISEAVPPPPPAAPAESEIFETTLKRRNGENGWDNVLLQTSADVTYIGKDINNGTANVGQIHAGATIKKTDTVEDVINLMLSSCVPPTYTAPKADVFMLYDDNTVQPIDGVLSMNSDMPGGAVSFKLYLHLTKNDAGDASAPKTFINGSEMGDKAATKAVAEKVQAIKTALTADNYGDDLTAMQEIVNTFSADTDYILEVADYAITKDIADICFKTEFAEGSVKQDNHSVDYPEGHIEACTIESGHLCLVPQLISLEFIKTNKEGENVNVFDDVEANLKELVKGIFITAPEGTKTVKFKIPKNAINGLKIFDDLVRDISKVFTKTEEGSADTVQFDVFTLDLAQPFPADTVFYFENGISASYKKWYY